MTDPVDSFVHEVAQARHWEPPKGASPVPSHWPRPTSRDIYANLLRDTRGLRREQEGARDLWFSGLAWEQKEEHLFELEMLLKGIACFGNLRNHPGPFRQRLAVAHDYRVELGFFREGVAQVVHLVRSLLGRKDRAYTFARYLETVLPEDAERGRLVQEQLGQDTPEDSLLLLRQTFSGFLEVADGLLRLDRVSHKQFEALHGMVVREVGRNAYFNPLVALEFRPEFDRIRNPHVLEALHHVESRTAHRIVALSFLTLFRSLRYLRLIERYASDGTQLPRACLVLSVLRSDLRTLTRFISRRAADVMAEGFERELLSYTAAEVRERHGHLMELGTALASLRSLLVHMAQSLQMEVQRVLEGELPPIEEWADSATLNAQLSHSVELIQTSVHHAVRSLYTELCPQGKEGDLSLDGSSRRAASERLRRDVWIFAQIMRAFLVKGEAALKYSQGWNSRATYEFVREFLRHFRAIGYQLVRSSDYGRLDHFLRAIEELREADLLEHEHLAQALRECRRFYDYLNELFSKVSLRRELRGLNFDKKAAGEALKAYLRAER